RAMTDARFLLPRDLAEGPTKLCGLEVRVVAKAPGSARRSRNHSGGFAALNKLGGAITVRSGAHVSRATIRCALETPQQQRVVFIVERLSREVGTAAPAFAVHAGSAAACR